MRVAAGVEAAIDALDWPAIEADLDAFGCAVAPKILSPQACREIAAMYARGQRFRSTIVMARHGFGRGEYKYFADPLPELVAALRRGFYRRLAPIANRWNAAMGVDVRYPAEHDGISRPLPRGRPDAADAAPAALRPGRLQLPAPGRLRRARLSAPGRDPAVASPVATSPAANSC